MLPSLVIPGGDNDVISACTHAKLDCVQTVWYRYAHAPIAIHYTYISADHVTYSQSDPSIWSHDCCFNAHFSVH